MHYLLRNLGTSFMLKKSESCPGRDMTSRSEKRLSGGKRCQDEIDGNTKKKMRAIDRKERAKGMSGSHGRERWEESGSQMAKRKRKKLGKKNFGCSADSDLEEKSQR